MKTQYVGVIFQGTREHTANPAVQYFKDSIGVNVGDDVIIRWKCNDLLIAKVIVVTPIEPLTYVEDNYIVSKVDKTDERKRRQYINNKLKANELLQKVVDSCLQKMPVHDAARTLLCSITNSALKENDPLWQTYFEAERLQKEVSQYEEEYGICE